MSAIKVFSEAGPCILVSHCILHRDAIAAPKESKRMRDAAAKSLREARTMPKGSYRDIVVSVADSYKHLAYDEERRKGEPERSKKRPSKR